MLIENWNHARHFTGALPLLVSRTQKPYARYSRLVGEDRIDSLAVKRADHLLRSGNTLALAIVDDGGISAIAAGSILPWDSRHCGFTAARIDLLSAAGTYGEARKCLEALLPAFLRKCGEAGVRHLSARVGAEELALVHTLEGNEFELLDGVQTLSVRLDSRPSDPTVADFTIRPATSGDEDQIAAIARTAYLHDRFHADPMLTTQQADAMHEDWMRNSCRGTAADAVLVAVCDDRVLGYVTCKLDADTLAGLGVSFGTIVLVASSEDSRGRGVATQTTQRALQWFWDQGTRIVEIGTQLTNAGAARVYEHAGFRVINVSLTFRRRLF
jgi:GNAT superfamily N-acetyltransferase